MKQCYLFYLVSSLLTLNFACILQANPIQNMQSCRSLPSQANKRIDHINLQALHTPIIELIGTYAGLQGPSYTALKDAIMQGNLQDIQTLLACGAQLNDPEQAYMQTVILRYTWYNKNVVAREKYKQIFYYLLHKKLNLHLKDKALNSALHCAADSPACLPIFKILIEKLKTLGHQQNLDVANRRGSTISDIIEKNLEMQSSKIAQTRLQSMAKLLDDYMQTRNNI